MQEEDEGATGAVLQHPGVRAAAQAVLGEVVQRSVGGLRRRAAGLVPASGAARKVGLMRATRHACCFFASPLYCHTVAVLQPIAKFFLKRAEFHHSKPCCRCGIIFTQLCHYCCEQRRSLYGMFILESKAPHTLPGRDDAAKTKTIGAAK